MGSVFLSAAGLMAGCIEEAPPDNHPATGGSPAIGEGEENGELIDEPDMGGMGGVGGCSSGIQPRLSYQCAGQVDEGAAVDARWARLLPQSPYQACQDGYGYPYYAYSGSSVAVGGSPAYGGMGGIGGWNPGPLPVPVDSWCADADPDDYLAGVSYALGPCQDTDLATPIRFREPDYGWYEVKVYAGQEACERKILLTQTAGYGTGDVVEMPLKIEEDIFIDDPFVSIEVITESYSQRIEVQHQPEVLAGTE